MGYRFTISNFPAGQDYCVISWNNVNNIFWHEWCSTQIVVSNKYWLEIININIQKGRRIYKLEEILSFVPPGQEAELVQISLWDKINNKLYFLFCTAFFLPPILSLPAFGAKTTSKPIIIANSATWSLFFPWQQWSASRTVDWFMEWMGKRK